MKTLSMAAALAGTTALFLPISAGPASAQQAASCQALLNMVTEAGDGIRQEFRQATSVAEANDETRCAVIIAEVERVGGMTDPATASGAETETETETETQGFTASDTVTSTVEVEQKAVVEGEVIVRLPDPEISVDQPGAEVSVREGTASVTVQEEAANIVVRQQQATITVDMPQPTITIEQPAPEIVITMPRANVSLDKGTPQVEVVMADPTVTVSQADPTLDVEVDARFVDPNSAEAQNTPQDGVVARTERLNAQGTGDSDEQPAVRFTKGEANVTMTESDQEAEISYNRAEPSVTYESADPQIAITSEGEPRVEIRRVGEPRVTFREAGGQQDEASASGGQPPAERRAALSPEDRARVLGLSDTFGMEMNPTAMRVSDLVGKDVVTSAGDDVGEISRIVTNNRTVFAVVTHGGFLGIGENEVALPLRRIAIRGEEALLLGLNEAELERMPDYDSSQNRRMREQDELEVRMIGR